MSGRRCLICRAASPAECAGGMDPRRTFAEPCGPFVTPQPEPAPGVPAYHPTEAQPTRVGGTET